MTLQSCSEGLTKGLLYLWASILCGILAGDGALAADGADTGLLRSVMPTAVSFSAREGDPPAYRAWGDAGPDGEAVLLGYVFRTPDLPPEEIGYSGPIDVLVGMDTAGVITGINVLNYYESYRSIRGDFLSTEGFQPQFTGKNITDGFLVGRDVDGVSRATITSWATARGIRNAARTVAAAYIDEFRFSEDRARAEQARLILGGQSWEDMRQSGLVRDMRRELPDGSVQGLTIAFMGHEVLGEVLIGQDNFSLAEREASSRFDGGALLLVAISGNSSDPFRQERLSVTQGDQHYPIPRPRFVYAGSADGGGLAGRARYSGAIVLPGALDLHQPFSVSYTFGDSQVMSVSDYQVPALPLALREGRPLPGAGGGASLSGNTIASIFAGAAWGQVALLLVLLTVAMTAFLRKSARLRWAALGGTLLYLGFIDGGFLSISHVTNLMKQGPSMVMDDLPLLLLIGFTLVTTLLWGRIFCSSLCPFGALQDIITRIVPRRFQKRMPRWIHDRALYIKYGLLAVILLAALLYAELSIFQYFEPFGTLFYFSPSLLLWSILAAILLGSVFVSRFYCRYLCPLGAALGLVSMISPWRIRRVPQCGLCRVCERDCPTGAIRGPAVDFKECVRCDICERRLIAKAGACRHDMQTIRVRMSPSSP